MYQEQLTLIDFADTMNRQQRSYEVLEQGDDKLLT